MIGKLIRLLKKRLLRLFKLTIQIDRVDLYSYLSNNKNIIGNPIIQQPTQFVGKGFIVFGKDVQLGYFPSPYFYSGYMYLEARNPTSSIIIGEGTIINNNVVIIAENEKIEIGKNNMIGCQVEIINSDFHHIHPEKRNSGTHISKNIKIGNNVFIGSNVKIMKGVIIGDNVVIANNAVVFDSMADNSIVKGNPAVVVKKIDL